MKYTKKQLKKAISLINKNYGRAGIIPMTLTLDVEEIAALMVEYAEPLRKELKELNDIINDPEELGEYLAGM